MIRDIYSIPINESRFVSGELEINSEIDEIIQQVDLLLFTKKGEVLMMPEFGCNLEEYLFDTTWNETLIKNIIEEQISDFVYTRGNYNISVDVKFVTWEYNVAMIVDLIINGKKVSSYMV